MLRLKLVLIFAVFSFVYTANAQQVPLTLDTAKIAYNQISQSMDLFVYPSQGQSKSQQKKDEVECWPVGE